MLQRTRTRRSRKHGLKSSEALWKPPHLQKNLPLRHSIMPAACYSMQTDSRHTGGAGFLRSEVTLLCWKMFFDTAHIASCGAAALWRGTDSYPPSLGVKRLGQA